MCIRDSIWSAFRRRWPLWRYEWHTRNTARNDTYVTDPKCVSWNEAQDIYYSITWSMSKWTRPQIARPKCETTSQLLQFNTYQRYGYQWMRAKNKTFSAVAVSFQQHRNSFLSHHDDSQRKADNTSFDLSTFDKKKKKTTSAFVCKIQTVLFAMFAQIESGNNQRKSD